MNLLDLLFPKSCLGCGGQGSYICFSCIQKVRKPKPACPVCLRPSIDGMTHVKCLTPQGLNGLTSLWTYDGVIRKAILALKYKFAEEIATELSDYAIRQLLTTTIPASDIVLIPVPLYWLRRNWRGFNQSEAIGKRIALSLGWKFAPDLLIRKELKVPQTELKRKERLQNVQGAFSVSRNISTAKRQALLISPYCNIILFDDVWTTGSTLKEEAKVLKRAGAEKVWGLTIARGLR